MERRQKKKINDYKRITLRYFVTLFLPVWLLGCFILWLFFYSESQKSRKSLEVSIAHTLDLQKESLILDFVSIVSDLNFLSRTVELSGFCERFDPLIKEKLDRGMVVFLKAKGFYDRIAIINASGKEIMSTDYREGTAYITPDDHLRDRSKEYYFQEISRMAPDELYISPFDLKTEHGEIQEPYEPMIRLGTPLVDRDGEKKGIIVINYLGKKVINRLKKIASDQIGDFMFLNRNSYWMKGRTSEEEWGFMFEGRQDRTFRYLYPEEWKKIAQRAAGKMVTANGLFSYATVFPFREMRLRTDPGNRRFLFSDRVTEKSYYWKLAIHVPPAVLEESSHRMFNQFRFIFFMMTCSLLASYIFLICAQYYRRCNTSLNLEKSKMDQIFSYGEKIRMITNLNTLIDFIIKQASLILESERCSLMLLDEETGELCIRGAIGLRYDIIKQSKVTLGEGIAGLVAEEGKPLLVEVIDEDKRIAKKNAPYYRSKSFLSVPVKLDHKLIGVVNVTDKKDKKNPVYTELDLKILLAIVRQAAVAIENAQLSKELKYLTITDPLTHLYNYRHLMECLAYEIKRFKRFRRPLCLLIIDVDDFKEYNDTYSQAEGNILLKKVGDILTENLREVDIICRYAGDEFVVILPDTDVDKVKTIAEKVRKTVETTEFKKLMTVSMGIAKSSKDMNRHDLILKADAALHKAKKDGKNRVFCQDK